MTVYPKRIRHVNPFCVLGEIKKTNKLPGAHFL
jgi:hypothetical protein